LKCDLLGCPYIKVNHFRNKLLFGEDTHLPQTIE
jgi:hypothetical protein